MTLSECLKLGCPLGGMGRVFDKINSITTAEIIRYFLMTKAPEETLHRVRTGTGVKNIKMRIG